MSKTVKFSNYEWYVIDENKGILFLKDKFDENKIETYFDKRILDSNKDVRFNPNAKNIWWADSSIRMVLNSKFLEDLDKDQMDLMEITASINDKERTTEDYVRLITREEAEELPREILKCSGDYGYWTMSPSNFSGWASARELVVFASGELTGIGVYYGYGVRPVIRLKSEYLKQLLELDSSSKKIEDDFEFTLSDNVWTTKQASELINNLSKLEKRLVDQINKMEGKDV